MDRLLALRTFGFQDGDRFVLAGDGSGTCHLLERHASFPDMNSGQKALNDALYQCVEERNKAAAPFLNVLPRHPHQANKAA